MFDECSNRPFVLDADIAGPGTRYSTYIIALILVLIPRNEKTLELRQRISTIILVQAFAYGVAALIQGYSGTLDLLHSMLAFQLVLVMLCEGSRISESLRTSDGVWVSPKPKLKKINDTLGGLCTMCLIIWTWHVFRAEDPAQYGPSEVSACNGELVTVVWFKSVRIRDVSVSIMPILAMSAGLNVILLSTFALVGFWCLLIWVVVLLFLMVLPFDIGSALLGRSSGSGIGGSPTFPSDPKRVAATEAGFPVFLRLVIALYRITMLELTLQRNWHMITIEGNAWGYGQIVPMIALIAVFSELSEPFLETLKSPEFQKVHLPTVGYWSRLYCELYLTIPFALGYAVFSTVVWTLSMIPISTCQHAYQTMSSIESQTLVDAFFSSRLRAALYFLFISPVAVPLGITLGIQFCICLPLLQSLKLVARHFYLQPGAESMEMVALMDDVAPVGMSGPVESSA